MPMSKDVKSYSDVIDMLMQVQANEGKPSAFECHTEGRAKHMRQKMYKYRLLDKEMSREDYGNENYNSSQYDNYTFEVHGTRLIVREIPPIKLIEGFTLDDL